MTHLYPIEFAGRNPSVLKSKPARDNQAEEEKLGDDGRSLASNRAKKVIKISVSLKDWLAEQRAKAAQQSFLNRPHGNAEMEYPKQQP